MKTWKVALLGFVATLLLDVFIHVETDPAWILYLHNVVWFGFGCALGESQKRERG